MILSDLPPDIRTIFQTLDEMDLPPEARRLIEQIPEYIRILHANANQDYKRRDKELRESADIFTAAMREEP